MRIWPTVLIALILGATPALGQNNTTHVFGSATCSQKVPCPNGTESMTPAELATTANQCLSDSLGLNTSNGLFDEYLGLDTNNCLAPKSSSQQTTNGKNIVPQCCVVQLPDQTCTFHCQLVSH